MKRQRLLRYLQRWLFQKTRKTYEGQIHKHLDMKRDIQEEGVRSVKPDCD